MPLSALILVGGLGTRLRPLTFSEPKPAVKVANLPLLVYQLLGLEAAGVTRVVFATCFAPERLVNALAPYTPHFGMEFIFSEEKMPLLSAGAIRLAKPYLCDADGTPFFVLNADIITDFSFESILSEFNRRSSSAIAAGFMVHRSEAWRQCGVPVMKPNEVGIVAQFVEKPSVFMGDLVNAGVFLLAQSVFDLIPEGRPCSLEREIFPKLVAEEKLMAFYQPDEMMWNDVGTIRTFLSATRALLAVLQNTERTDMGRVITLEGNIMLPVVSTDEKTRIAFNEGCFEFSGSYLLTQRDASEGGFEIKGSVLAHKSATIGAGAVVGPDVVLGAFCNVGWCARVCNATLLEAAHIDTGCYIENSIIGKHSYVKPWGRIVDETALGSFVQVEEGMVLCGCRVSDHTTVNVSHYQATDIF